MAIQVNVSGQDITGYLYYGDGSMATTGGSGDTTIRWDMVLGYRGTANIPLIIRAPQPGQRRIPSRTPPSFIYDGPNQFDNGRRNPRRFNVGIGELVQIFEIDFSTGTNKCVWNGTVHAIDDEYPAPSSDHLHILTCNSLEQVFDTIRIPPMVFVNQTAGFIVATLLQTVCAGVPVGIGKVYEGVNVPSLVIDWDTVSSIFSQLAAASNFSWWVDPAGTALMFGVPSDTAPFVVEQGDLVYATTAASQTRQDYRNRQIVKLADNAFGISSVAGDGPDPPTGNVISTVVHTGVFDSAGLVPVYPSQITGAWALSSGVRSNAVGTFTGQPQQGDTITLGNPTAGVVPWSPNTLFGIGNQVADLAGHIQRCIKGGVSGSVEPTWNDNGGITNDGPLVQWQDTGQGQSYTYRFVNQLDNTQWGQVLIGPDAATTGQNFCAAVNADPTLAGIGYSLPTFEHFQCNCTGFNTSLLNFTVYVKSPGAPGPNSLFVCALSANCSVFSWDDTQTHGGSVGSATVLSVSPPGGDNTSQVQWSPDSDTITINGNFAGKKMQIEYRRLGGNEIVCEDTSQVNIRAQAEGGSGKYQQKTDMTSVQNPWYGLMQCQGILNAYDAIPTQFQFDTDEPYLQPGQTVEVQIINNPALLGNAVNGFYIIQEVQAQLVNIGAPEEHFRYTVRIINAPIGTYIQFWLDLKGQNTSTAFGFAAAGNAAPAATVPGRVTCVPKRTEFGGITLSKIMIRSQPDPEGACELHAMLAYVDERDLTQFNVSQPGDYVVYNGANVPNGSVPNIGNCDTVALLAGISDTATSMTVDVPGGSLTGGLPTPDTTTAGGFILWMDGEQIVVGQIDPIFNGSIKTGYTYSLLTRGFNGTTPATHNAGALGFEITDQPTYCYQINWVDDLNSQISTWPGAPNANMAFFGSWKGGARGDFFRLKVKEVTCWPSQLDIGSNPLANYTPGNPTSSTVYPEWFIPLKNACVCGLLIWAATPNGGRGPVTALHLAANDNYWSQGTGKIRPVLPGIRTFDGSGYKLPTWKGWVYKDLVMDVPWCVTNPASIRTGFCFSTEAPNDRFAQLKFECHLQHKLRSESFWRCIAALQYWVDETGKAKDNSWEWLDFLDPGANGEFYPPPGDYINKYPDHPDVNTMGPRMWPPWTFVDTVTENTNEVGDALGLLVDSQLRWVVVNSGGKPFSCTLTADMDEYTQIVTFDKVKVTDPIDGQTRSLRPGDYIMITPTDNTAVGEIMQVYWFDQSLTTNVPVTVFRAVGQTRDPITATPATHANGDTILILTAGAAKDLTCEFQC